MFLHLRVKTDSNTQALTTFYWIGNTLFVFIFLHMTGTIKYRSILLTLNVSSFDFTAFNWQKSQPKSNSEIVIRKNRSACTKMASSAILCFAEASLGSYCHSSELNGDIFEAWLVILLDGDVIAHIGKEKRIILHPLKIPVSVHCTIVTARGHLMKRRLLEASGWTSEQSIVSLVPLPVL